MNKTAIKNFATWARRKLIEDITYKANLLGISEKGIEDELPQSTSDLKLYDVGMKDPATISGKDIKKRESLVEAIKAKEQSFDDYKKGFEAVIDEVAYTWFNRLIAIRFMEANDYLPSGVRVLSSESDGKREPDLVTNPFDSDLEFNDSERDMIFQLKDENKLDELFRMLFIKQCNSLHRILPVLFEETDDYSELLIPISFTDEEGIVHKLVNDIDEEDFREQVEIIGWLYQYYISEKKDEVFAALKKNKKITKENIPAATQLFTPDWIVKYMVENSLGRLWLEGHPNEELQNSWKYYLEEAEQEAEVQAELDRIIEESKTISPEDITVLDPSMGSGHILVYAFDVLYQIYVSAGYSEREIPKLILEKNLYGLDIDDRAGQLAYFSLIMKARSYSRRLFRKVDENNPIKVNVCSIQESNGLTQSDVKYFANGDKELEKYLAYLVEVFTDAKEYGSILDVHPVDFDKIENRLEEIRTDITNLFNVESKDRLVEMLPSLIKQGRIMSMKYDVCVTNPPYMGSNGMSSTLNEYIKSNYLDAKTDLFACFIEKGNNLVKKNKFNCMVTMQSWMFLSSFEKFRKNLISNKCITNLMHMENMVMGIAFGTSATIFRNTPLPKFKGTYNLIKLKDIVNEKPKEFPIKTNYYKQICTSNFSKIPGTPIAYWVPKQIYNSFLKEKKMIDVSEARMGLTTGQNEKYLRLWHEVAINNIGFGFNRESARLSSLKWFPYDKAGDFRKWYGNREYIVNWFNDGYEMQTTKHPSGTRIWAHNFNLEYNFREHISWNDITSGNISFRYFENGFLFDSAAATAFVSPEKKYAILGYLNSKFVSLLSKILNPTIHFKLGDFYNLPFKESDNITIPNLSKENVSISKKDWDSFETSWDFKKHPLLCNGTSIYSGLGDTAGGNYPKSKLKKEESDNGTKWYEEGVPAHYRLEEVFNEWSQVCENRFNQLKANEEELNRIFIDIYGLQDELTPEVEDKDVTIRKADKERDIKSFISYAVGCMLGRYSLDVEGLAYAGGEWDSSKYKTFIPDPDNCIPITDEEYFDDDIVGRFVEFVKIVFGEKTLEENLKFIADALGTKGKTSREVIRNYFLKDFIKDHNKIYQKRPIYWMFDSGKQNGFKALVYMHRWNADTIGNMRIEYLHRMQRVYEKEIIRMQDIMDTSDNNKAIKDATKAKEKLQKQLKEAKDYDEKVAHLALSRIDIDLDDGVKVNYEKVQTANDGKKLEILAKI